VTAFQFFLEERILNTGEKERLDCWILFAVKKKTKHNPKPHFWLLYICTIEIVY